MERLRNGQLKDISVQATDESIGDFINHFRIESDSMARSTAPHQENVLLSGMKCEGIASIGGVTRDLLLTTQLFSVEFFCI